MYTRKIPSSITHAGVVFLIFLFIMVMLYFILSNPVDTLLDAFGDADVALANEEMAEYLPPIKTATKIAFALGIATPMTWFIFWVFHREPFHGYYRRY